MENLKDYSNYVNLAYAISLAIWAIYFFILYKKYTSLKQYISNANNKYKT
jgi:hypothetical protein